MEFIASLHPKFVHFPIALFMVYSLFEVIGIVFKKDLYTKAAYIILILSLLGCVAAVLTGDQASQQAVRWSDQLEDTQVTIPLGAIDKHEDFANYSMWYILGLTVLRTFLLVKKKFQGALRYAFIVLSLLGSLLIFETAHLGGKLVYASGVGTDLVNPAKLK